MRAKFGVLQQTRGVRLYAEIRLDRFILSSPGSEKPHFLQFFWTSAFSGSDRWRQSEKVERGAQLQTLSNGIKIVLYSDAFLEKSCAQTLTFKSVTNKQRDKKTQRFWPPRCPVKSEPLEQIHPSFNS